MGVEAYSNSQYRNIYQNQNEFNRFFQSEFDKYDRNRDGRLDRREFQPLINDMCMQIQQRYGSGATLDKIRQAWLAMDRDNSGYITRQEFSTKAKYELERILSQPNYGPQAGYGAGYGAQPGYGPHPGHVAPGYGKPHW